MAFYPSVAGEFKFVQAAGNVLVSEEINISFSNERMDFAYQNPGPVKSAFFLHQRQTIHPGGEDVLSPHQCVYHQGPLQIVLVHSLSSQADGELLSIVGSAPVVSPLGLFL